jgi:hypothetical protein
MHALGVSLIVCGMAFLVSGLLFLIPTERKLSSRQDSFEESQERMDYFLQLIRKLPKH